MRKKFISWRRVSTAKQRGSHLGLEAQKSIIDFFVEREKGELIADYEECHSGTDLAGCTELKKAKAHCKKTGATLIIAKTDRCRDTIEALQLYEEMNGKIYFCDLPHTDKFTLTLFFSLAEREAMIVSLRTKQALAALKARGDVKLGAASEKYQESVRQRTERQIELIAAKKRKTHQDRYMCQKETKAFVTVLKRVFPAACQSSRPNEWSWGKINTRGEKKKEMLRIMSDFHTLDDTIFKDWDFSKDINSLQRKLSTKIYSLKRSALRAN